MQSVNFLDSRLPERFWAKCTPEPNSGCWIWTAALDSIGYGSTNGPSGRTCKAHRLAYLTLVGPVPIGLELDHKCRTRCCVNPAHLEPVTHRENMRRSAPARRPTCPAGHQYTGRNLILHKGRRSCRTCMYDRNREFKKRARADRKRAGTLTVKQIAALALLCDGRRSAALVNTPIRIGGRVAAELVRLGLAVWVHGERERVFEITAAGRAAYEKAVTA